MINIDEEEVVLLSRANSVIPGRPHPNTAYRWWKYGVNSRSDSTQKIQLETVLIGGLRYTSREAIRRFIEAQNAHQNSSGKITPKQRQRQSAAARRELQAMGV